MFKLLRRLIALALLAGIVFLALSLWKGGDPFRWFGKQSEKAGEVIRDRSEDIGKEADRIKKQSGDLKEATEKVKNGIQETGKIMKDVSGTSGK
jgi:hypothetical protein